MKAPEEKEEKRMERIARSEKKHRALADWLELVTEVMEIAVAVIVLVGFFISIIPILKEMPSLLDNTNAYSFHVFLEHAFNLVIGIEFVRMLIKHTPGSALGVLLFAIARHMVLDSGSGLERCRDRRYFCHPQISLCTLLRIQGRHHNLRLDSRRRLCRESRRG